MAFNIPDPHFQHPWGAIPLWTPEGRNPFARKKHGQGPGCFIWPRDVKMQGTPVKSTRRWKDILTGKGPPIYYGHRNQFGPTKPTWSNWLDPELGNLGYYDERALDIPDPEHTKRYDFSKRRFTNHWQRPDVWSDVKWGKDRKIPLYVRDGWGRESTKRRGPVQPFDESPEGNEFRYRFGTQNWDWVSPELYGIENFVET